MTTLIVELHEMQAHYVLTFIIVFYYILLKGRDSVYLSNLNEKTKEWGDFLTDSYWKFFFQEFSHNTVFYVFWKIYIEDSFFSSPNTNLNFFNIIFAWVFVVSIYTLIAFLTFTLILILEILYWIISLIFITDKHKTDVKKNDNSLYALLLFLLQKYNDLTINDSTKGIIFLILYVTIITYFVMFLYVKIYDFFSDLSPLDYLIMRNIVVFLLLKLMLIVTILFSFSSISLAVDYPLESFLYIVM